MCILNRYVLLVRSKSTCIGEEDSPHNEKCSRCMIFEWGVVLGAPDRVIPCMTPASVNKMLK